METKKKVLYKIEVEAGVPGKLFWHAPSMFEFGARMRFRPDLDGDGAYDYTPEAYRAWTEMQDPVENTCTSREAAMELCSWLAMRNPGHAFRVRRVDVTREHRTLMLISSVAPEFETVDNRRKVEEVACAL